MGCDIHSFVEIRKGDKWECLKEAVFKLDEYDRKNTGATHTSTPFKCSNYGLFGFLANVRNYSSVPPLVSRRGLPESPSDDVLCEAERDRHSFTWVTANELLSFDYDSAFEDRRDHTGNSDTLPKGEGKILTYREFLPERFFEDLEAIRMLGEPLSVRLVFCFDS